ncbi:MAG: aldo/keto reductase [Paracoccaceae bacterium]
MQKRQMGRDGQAVGCLGVGAMSFSDFYGPTSEENSFAILDAALEVGVTHLDTSNVYGMGRSEKAIGVYLQANTAARDAFHIATKASITTDADGNRYFDNSPEHLEAELDKSLQRLNVDCVDLFYVHRRDTSIEIEQVTETLAALVRKGKTRSIGFSEIAPTSLRRAQAVHPVAAVQSEYSLWTRSPEMGLIQTCAELDVALVAFSPVGRSMLTDHPLTKEIVATLSFLKGNPRFQSPNYEENLRLSDGFRKLAAEFEIPAAGLAIAWTLAKGDHVIPIPGTRSVGHFNELVAGTKVALNADEVARIETVLPIGWAHGDRYSYDQWVGPERFC